MAVLKYRDSTGAYIPVSYGGPTAVGMNDLTDADTITAPPAVGDSLVWDGTSWVPQNNRYANAAARDLAIPAPQEGMQTWLIDVNSIEVFRDGIWSPGPGQSGLLVGSGLTGSFTFGTEVTIPLLPGHVTWGRAFDVSSGQIAFATTGIYHVDAFFYCSYTDSISQTLSHTFLVTTPGPAWFTFYPISNARIRCGLKHAGGNYAIVDEWVGAGAFNEFTSVNVDSTFTWLYA